MPGIPIPYGPGWNNATHSYPTPPQSGTTSLPAGAVGGWDPAAGGVPTVPNPVATAGQAISGNAGNFGSLASLGNRFNQFTGQQALQQYQNNLPLYNQLTGQASSNILSNLSGQIPQDVQNLMAQQAAERGVATGSPGSPNSNAALLRGLGLTSLDLQNQGQQQLTAAIGRTPTGQQFNPSQFFVTPDQQQQAQLGANLYASAPNPASALAARFAAMGAGLGQGQRATGPQGAPTSSQGMVGDILSRYAPTVGGTPSPSPFAPPSGGGGGFGAAWNSAGGYADTSGASLPDNFDQMSEADQLDWLSGIDTSGMDSGASFDQSSAPAPVFDTSSYYPDASSGDYWDFSSGDFGGG